MKAKRPIDPIAAASPEQVRNLWTKYRVRWHFLSRLCGSTPADPEVIRRWLLAREPLVKPAGALSIEETQEEVLASIERGEGEPDQEYSLLVFQHDAGGVVMRASTIKAHVKDCARVLSAQFIGGIKGERRFSTRVINGVYLDKSVYYVPIWRPTADGLLRLAQADSAEDRMVHAHGPQGPVNALKRFEYLEPPTTMEFTLLVLGRSVSETDLHHLFTYGGTHGYAGERSNGEGRYTYELSRIDDAAAVERLGPESDRAPDSDLRRVNAKV